MDTTIGGVPLWLFLLLMVASLLIGQGIRLYLDHRKAREAERLKQKAKDIKREMKHQRKLAKKAKKKAGK